MDILSKKTEAPKKTAPKKAKRYLVCVGSCETRRSRRFLTYAEARRLAARAKRFGLDAYVSSPIFVTL